MARFNPLYPVLGIVSVLVACESYRSTSPTAASGVDSGAPHAMASPVTFPIPGPVKVPGGNPVAAPVPGGTSGTPGGGGGGGGSPSPSPTPEPTPTPTPVPTPTPIPTVPCPATLTISAAGTPMLISDATNNPSVFPQITTNYDDSCVVKEVKITMFVTTVTGFTGSFTSPSAQLGVCGLGVGFNGCGGSILYSFQFNATGNNIGTSCSDFAFNTTATTPFSASAPPPAPYSGTYQLDAARNGVGDQWRLKDLEYQFINTFNHPADTILECASIVITTQTVVTPAP